MEPLQTTSSRSTAARTTSACHASCPRVVASIRLSTCSEQTSCAAAKNLVHASRKARGHVLSSRFVTQPSRARSSSTPPSPASAAAPAVPAASAAPPPLLLLAAVALAVRWPVPVRWSVPALWSVPTEAACTGGPRCAGLVSSGNGARGVSAHSSRAAVVPSLSASMTAPIVSAAPRGPASTAAKAASSAVSSAGAAAAGRRAPSGAEAALLAVLFAAPVEVGRLVEGATLAAVGRAASRS